jgi:hypothetical protein
LLITARGGREGGREGRREGGREDAREGEWEGGRGGGRDAEEGGREGGMQERLKLTEGGEDLITNGFSFLVSYCFPPPDINSLLFFWGLIRQGVY